jgi:hypothetical protein
MDFIQIKRIGIMAHISVYIQKCYYNQTMVFEKPHPAQEVKKSSLLAKNFSEQAPENLDHTPFTELESALTQAGFTVADTLAVQEVFNNPTLFCRSENFSKTMDLILDQTPLTIENSDNHANMCTMSAATGYKIAMSEGFSGKDVGGVVKVVITFESTHITNHAHIDATDDLWKFKPQTAEVSIAGSGQIYPEDIAMISFRFPIHFYPEDKLSESEKELLDEEKISFVVRHYTQKRAAH